MNNINNQYQGVTQARANNAQVKSDQKTQDLQQQASTTQNQHKAQESKTLPNQGADQAKFTPESQTLLRMTQASKGVSEIDQKKVDEIKQALESGQFPIDTARIAEKMTDLEKLIQG
jgi:negative regulator of flagellin synthesis FlgM